VVDLTTKSGWVGGCRWTITIGRTEGMGARERGRKIGAVEGRRLFMDAGSWRLLRKSTLGSSRFTGEWSGQNGGRWNSRGVAVVYNKWHLKHLQR
jgi:hypothetical protein